MNLVSFWAVPGGRSPAFCACYPPPRAERSVWRRETDHLRIGQVSSARGATEGRKRARGLQGESCGCSFYVRRIGALPSAGLMGKATRWVVPPRMGGLAMRILLPTNIFLHECHRSRRAYAFGGWRSLSRVNLMGVAGLKVGAIAYMKRGWCCIFTL